MTVKPVYLPMMLCSLLFSCQQSETNEVSTPTEMLVNTSVYPAEPIQLMAPANLRLSYIGRTVTDSSIFYQVVATYKGENVGFNLSVPKGEEGRAWFFSKGKMSDDLLHIWQGAYRQSTDTSASPAVVDAPVRFSETVLASLAALGVLKDSSGALVTQNKLLFRSTTANDSAELYLDINEKDHWIELSEKDTVYRRRLIRCLTQ